MPDTDDPRPRPWWRRPFARLSVRGLMVLVLAAAAGLGWFVNRAAAHRRDVELLRKAADASRPFGYIGFADVLVRNGKTSPMPKPIPLGRWSPDRWAPAWLRKALGDDAFREPMGIQVDFARLKDQDPHDVVAAALRLPGLRAIGFRNPPAGVSIRGLPDLGGLILHGDTASGEPHAVAFGDLPKLTTVGLQSDGVTDDTLASLAGCPGLTSVRVVSRKVTGPGLRHLARLSKLQRLSIDCPNLTDAGLEGIAPLAGLQRLELRAGPGVTDAGLARLEGLTGLVDLVVWRTAATDAVFDRLAPMPALGRLAIGESPGVRGSGFPALAKRLPKLPRLELTRCPVTDDALAGLSGLDSLEFLDLWGTQVHGPGLKDLAALPSLREVWLVRTDVGDEGLAYLEPLKTLRRLNLAGTPITSAGLAHLAGLAELRFVNIGATQVDDAGLDHLRGLRNLRQLMATNSRVTDAGVKRLRDALPTLGQVSVGKPAPRPTAGEPSP